MKIHVLSPKAVNDVMRSKIQKTIISTSYNNLYYIHIDIDISNWMIILDFVFSVIISVFGVIVDNRFI